jgi:hypothetical protein
MKEMTRIGSASVSVGYGLVAVAAAVVGFVAATGDVVYTPAVLGLLLVAAVLARPAEAARTERARLRTVTLFVTAMVVGVLAYTGQAAYGGPVLVFLVALWALDRYGPAPAGRSQEG